MVAKSLFPPQPEHALSSTFRDWIFRQNRAEAPERFLGGCLRRHSFADNVGFGRAPDLLGVRFRNTGIEHGIVRYRRLQHALGGVGHSVWIGRIEPEWV